MKIGKIVNLINKMCDSGVYDYSDLEDKLDEAIYAINDKLGTKYPTFSSFNFNTEYTDYLDFEYKEFPDDYIHNVVCYYAAYKMMEQEDDILEPKYQKFWMNATQWLDKMWKNILQFVDEDKRRIQGFVQLQWDKPTDEPKEVKKIYVNPNGTYTVEYADGTKLIKINPYAEM